MSLISSIPKPRMRLRTLKSPGFQGNWGLTDTDTRFDTLCDYRTLYQSVTLEENQFRLIVLPPGEFHEFVNCQLVVETLDAPSHFIALSYTWQWDSWSYIEINGIPFKVSGEILRALQRLRHQQGAVFVWIDAICINQTDILEKTQQVLQMHQIYRNAHEVVIWLCDGPDDECQSIVSLLCDLSRASEKHPISDQDYFKDIRTSLINHFPSHDAWKLIYIFFASNWWRRTWTVQELLLGTSVWILLGPAELRWDAMELSVAFLQRVRDAVVAAGQPHPEKAVKMMDELLGRTAHTSPEEHLGSNSGNAPKSIDEISIAAGWEPPQRYSEDNPMVSMSQITEVLFDPWLMFARKHFEEKQGFELLDLLVATWERGVEDRRDKIYGLYHLIRTPRPDLIRPDYNKSVVSLYKELAQYLITQSSNLDVLLFVSPLLRASAQKYPSWCQNWVLESSDVLDMAERYSRRGPIKFGKRAQLHFSASGSSHPLAEIHDDTLIIKGGCVGKVQTSHREIVVDESNPLHNYLGLLGQLLNSGVITSFEDEYPLGGNYVEAFRRVTFHSFDYAEDPFTQAAVLNEVTENENSETYNKFITEGGLLGFAFGTVKSLDIICLLYGGKTPFILRPCGMSDDGETLYHLVSSCYVHGMMHGELMDTSEGVELRAPYSSTNFKIL